MADLRSLWQASSADCGWCAFSLWMAAHRQCHPDHAEQSGVPDAAFLREAAGRVCHRMVHLLCIRTCLPLCYSRTSFGMRKETAFVTGLI